MKRIKLITLLVLCSFSKTIYSASEDPYDFHWLDSDKEVYVLQKKQYPKESNFYLQLGVGRTLNQDFQSSTPFQFSINYYFTETFGMYLDTMQYKNSNNDSYKTIVSINQTEPFVRRLKSTYGIGIWYSPFYGKINTFNKIIYFDWSFGLGLSSINAESNKSTVANSDVATTFESEQFFGPKIKTQFMIHLNNRFSLGLEFQDQMYFKEGPTSSSGVPSNKSLRQNIDGLLFFSVRF